MKDVAIGLLVFIVFSQNNSLSDSFITNKEVEKELKLIEKNEKELEKRSDESKNDGGR